MPLFFIFLISACQQEGDTLFNKLSSAESGISFRNTLKETDAFNVMKYSYFYNGGGVAIGDLNNDGLPDIYFTGNLVASHLYMNEGDWQFREVAEEAGVAAAGLWNTGVSMADVNNDGWLDIYVCRSAAVNSVARRNLLFINLTGITGEVTFSEEAISFGLSDEGYSTQSAFFDYDGDGDLDMYLLNHSLPEYANFTNTIGQLKNRSDKNFSDKLYQNIGGGFVDVTESAGIHANVLGFGLGVAISDLNDDGWPDIYVSNDFHEEDYLFLNNRDGTFHEGLGGAMDHTSLFSMGSDAADINNDGSTDLVTLDMLPGDNYRIKLTSGPDNFDKYERLLSQGFYRQTMRNMLHVNDGSGGFKEVGQLAGISNTDWSWSVLMADYDLDGLQDIFITNGYLRDYTNMDFLTYAMESKRDNPNLGSDADVRKLLEAMPTIEVSNQIFKNIDGVSFEEQSDAWGFDQIELSNGAAYGDLDNDGDLDLVINNVNDFASVYRNSAVERNKGNYLKVQLAADSMTAIGSKMYAYIGDQIMQRELFLSRGFQSSVEPVLYLGLGVHTAVDSLHILWPDGHRERFQIDSVNASLTLKKGDGSIATIPAPGNVPKIFLRNELFSFLHVEDDFNDFRHQPMLSTYYSRQGPSLVVGDLNNDGLEDIICGGAAGQEMAVFVNKGEGGFSPMPQPTFTADATFEDVALALADVDGDSDLDLVAASGGNMVSEGDDRYRLRIYKNNGSGLFSSLQNTPELSVHASCLALGDYDADGDIDVFVGGQYQAQTYPLASKNHILANDGQGGFTAMSGLPFTDNKVSAASAADIDGDGRTDLVVVGEWEGVEVWTLESEWSKSYSYPVSGWYSSIHAANLDEDIQLEIVVGNWGLNSQLQASEQHPIILYSGDFDDNGTIDPILSTYMGDESFPFVSRDDLLGQLPGLKKHFLSYDAYGKYTMDELLKHLPDAKADTITQLASLLLDIVQDSVVARVLPWDAQVAPIHAIADLDVDFDGDQDLILVGNSIYNRVKIGEVDANHGVILENQGGLTFSSFPDRRTGLNLKGAARSIAIITSAGEANVVFGMNDRPVQSYRLMQAKQPQ